MGPQWFTIGYIPVVITLQPTLAVNHTQRVTRVRFYFSYLSQIQKLHIYKAGSKLGSYEVALNTQVTQVRERRKVYSKCSKHHAYTIQVMGA